MMYDEDDRNVADGDIARHGMTVPGLTQPARYSTRLLEPLQYRHWREVGSNFYHENPTALRTYCSDLNHATY